MPRVRIIGGTDNPAREGLVSLYVEGASADVDDAEQEGIRTHLRKADTIQGNILDLAWA